MSIRIEDAVRTELDAIRLEMNKLHEEMGMAQYRLSMNEMDLSTLGRLTAIRQLLTLATEKFKD